MTSPLERLPEGRLAGPLDRRPALVYLARLAPGSRRTMRQALNLAAGLLTSGQATGDTLPWELVGYQHAQAVRPALLDRYKPATVNKVLAALRGVLRECWRLGLTSAEAYHRATDLPPVRGVTLPAGRELSTGEIRALFQACAVAASPGGARDAALLALLYGAGLRRAEVVALDVGDYAAGGQVTIRRGKGGRERLTYLPAGGRAALAAWLALRGELETSPGDTPAATPGVALTLASRGVDPPERAALLVAVGKSGRLARHRLTGQAVYDALQKRALQAGVPPFTPHDLRRSFISHLLEEGADISTVQTLAGHANVTTTQRYDRRGEGTRRDAVNLLHVPYQASQET